MLELSGNTLGKRQQLLNKEVNKTKSDHIDFSSIKGLEEKSDIDRLYKIDVASAYKNIDYLIETLKCGDSLYISRVLKCSWLYEKDNSSKINPDYLHHEVIPFMSMKMKKKLLTAISVHVRDEKRAEAFHKYCITDKTLKNISEKFLIWTSEQYKLEFVSSGCIENINHFIGNSFELAEACLAKEKSKNYNTNNTVHELRYLIKISADKYLDMMESYTILNTESRYGPRIPKLGLRLSKLIMTKHKQRVLNNIQLYFQKLHIHIIEKYSTVEDCKQYAFALLPNTVQRFWSMNFYKYYKKIFDKFPQNELYTFLKKIFEAKYPNESFEMSKDFYDLEYYQLLSDKQREMWALEHLKQNNELLGPDENFLWYGFVNYEMAFKEIQKFVHCCTNGYKRATMLSVLIDSANNDEELCNLLSYYYDRHVNEPEDNKMIFIDNVTAKKNVFLFSDKCWESFCKILYSTNITTPDNSYSSKSKYKTFIILYHILYEKTIPEFLENYVITNSNGINIRYEKDMLVKQLTVEQLDHVYQKLIALCESKLKVFEGKTYDDAVKNEARECIDFAILIMVEFGKTKLNCPDIILKYVKLDWEYYKIGSFFFNENTDRTNTEAKLLKLLKADSSLFLDKVPELYTEDDKNIRINTLLKKIKVYFPNDIAKQWLSCCESVLQKHENKIGILPSVIFAIFHIGSDDYKITFVSKYVPEAKIDHCNIDQRMLTIQEAICRFAHYSRPCLPLECILPYIKGDYVKYCLPMFGSYLSNLPMPECIKFVSTILNQPVSVQKHGLRLAFQCFSVEDLSQTISKVWKSTKNVSLRLTIYKALLKKIENEKDDSQKELYDILKMFTLNLNENDDEVFCHLTSFRVSQFKGDFLKVAWSAVRNLSERKSKNINRKSMIINEIASDIEIVDKKFCHTEILDEFIRTMLTDKNICGIYDNNDKTKALIDAKWKLAVKYIIYIDKDQMHKSLELLQYILQRCIDMWNMTDKGIYVSRMFMFWFINEILHDSYDKNNKADSIPILEKIIELLIGSLPLGRYYTLYVKMNLIVISKRVVGSNESNYMHLVPEKIASELAREVIKFLNDLKVTNMFYPSFHTEITSSFLTATSTLCYSTNLNKESIATLVSSRLLEADFHEAHLLALSILPRESPEDCAHIWRDVISKIQSGNNAELNAYLFEHFMNENFKEL